MLLLMKKNHLMLKEKQKIKYFKPPVIRPQWLYKWLTKDDPTFFDDGMQCMIDTKSIPEGMTKSDVVKYLEKHGVIPYVGERPPVVFHVRWSVLFRFKAGWIVRKWKNRIEHLFGVGSK